MSEASSPQPWGSIEACLRRQVPGGIIEFHLTEVLIEGIYSLAELRAVVAAMEEIAASHATAEEG